MVNAKKISIVIIKGGRFRQVFLQVITPISEQTRNVSPTVGLLLAHLDTTWSNSEPILGNLPQCWANTSRRLLADEHIKL